MLVAVIRAAAVTRSEHSGGLCFLAHLGINVGKVSRRKGAVKGSQAYHVILYMRVVLLGELCLLAHLGINVSTVSRMKGATQGHGYGKPPQDVGWRGG